MHTLRKGWWWFSRFGKLSCTQTGQRPGDRGLVCPHSLLASLARIQCRPIHMSACIHVERTEREHDKRTPQQSRCRLMQSLALPCASCGKRHSPTTFVHVRTYQSSTLGPQSWVTSDVQAVPGRSVSISGGYLGWMLGLPRDKSQHLGGPLFNTESQETGPEPW
jgi:hypothetical protein